MRTAFLHWLRRVVSGPTATGQTLSFTQRQAYVHPCVINNKPHIVYPRGLSTQEPNLFRSLEKYYRGQGYTLKEDQRGTSTCKVAHERRRWMPILIFTTDLLFEGAAFAETKIVPTESDALAHRQVELLLTLSHANNYPAGELPAGELHTLPAQKTKPAISDSVAARKIYDLLRQRYRYSEADPAYILDDFREIADYYSGFPEIVTMLDNLKNKNWRLEYDEHSWVTVASGNVFNVDNAVVHFNTRSAAQLKMYNLCKDNPVCIASPADALLHELLHTHSMLVNTREFIAQGGMNTVMYPYKHEYAIIDAERKLYASMSQRDATKRPQRIDHTGRLVKAQCATCIK